MSTRVSRSKFLALALFFVPISAMGAVTWRIYRDIPAMRETAASLRSEMHQLEMKSETLKRQRAAAQSQLTLEQRAPAMAALPRVAAAANFDPPNRPRMQLSGIQPQLLGDPRYAGFAITAERQAIEEKYAPLFAELRLLPEILAQFKELLVQRNVGNLEVTGIMENEAMREKRATDRRATMDVQRRVAAVFASEIREMLGPANWERFNSFENAAVARRDVLEKLVVRLSYSIAPLNDTQARQLADVYRVIASERMRSGTAPTRSFGELAERASAFLGPVKLEALRELQAEADALVTMRFSTSTRPEGTDAVKVRPAPQPE